MIEKWLCSLPRLRPRHKTKILSNPLSQNGTVVLHACTYSLTVTIYTRPYQHNLLRTGIITVSESGAICSSVIDIGLVLNLVRVRLPELTDHDLGPP